MLLVKLSKPVKTVVKSFQIGEDKKNVKDAEGNDVVTATREVLISDVQIPQYENIDEAIQAAGSADKLLEYINKSVKADAVSPVRLVGASFTADNTDEEIVNKGRELASTFNAFTDKRKGEGVKALADKFKELQKLAASGTASDAELLALIKGGKL
jgi:hypothetical protein